MVDSMDIGLEHYGTLSTCLQYFVSMQPCMGREGYSPLGPNIHILISMPGPTCLCFSTENEEAHKLSGTEDVDSLLVIPDIFPRASRYKRQD